ncbi:mu-type opioid receptor-like [Plectropomus leopardus]|uniref:mu-type opioid receptor-like n=1 Tax=Plectropomus leopardus TaxID=160734 RepID=UPI001C4AF114|nr:mu-type opioid receptor-like [Plectropomus leopardus]
MVSGRTADKAPPPVTAAVQVWLFPLCTLVMINITLVPLSVDFDSPGDYFLFIFHTLAGASTVIVAGSVACGIIKTHALLRQNRFIFMLNTSICDTMTGCGIFYQFLFDVRVGFPSKNGAYYILPSLLGVNIMTFLFAQFDRYFAVCHPFFYGRFITKRVVICVNVYSWVHVYTQLIIQHVVPLSKAIQIATYSRISLMLIIITKITMTVKLLVVAKHQLLREPPGPERDSKKESLLIIVLVVVFFLLLWGPAMLYTVLSSLTGKYFFYKNDAVNPMKILSRSNALCTPSLYLCASPSLRTAVWKTVWSKICCCKKSKRLVGIITLRETGKRNKEFVSTSAPL